MTERAYKVYAIENGTVIDHIPTPLALKVVRVLGLHGEGILTIGIGFSSKKMTSKDIVKVENRELSPEETNMIALIAPDATINIIKDGRVAEKRRISPPDEVRGIMTCPNPNCASNRLGAVSLFRLEVPEQVLYRCHYCERAAMAEPDLIVLPPR
ncbi:aspartate carbamoyltransferase regulatory subunit [Candidatus Fermentibacterales bacterium]|nr:aspartate carbamoyltransferase regulatory subunit [Candidatus Fermentibacterales bacterium]